MAQYNDGNPGDINPNEDNYWAFATGQTVTATMDGMIGYSFRPMDIYETQFSVRDGAGTAGAGDGDYVIHTRQAANPHPNDGVAFGGNAYWVTHAWAVEAEFQYAGTDETVTATVIVSRIRNPDNNNDPLNGTAVVRFDDVDMQTIFEGPDGDGGVDYPMNQIENVTIGDSPNQINQINIANRYDDPYPVICFAGGTLIETEAGSVPVERLRKGDRVRTMDHGFQPIRWIGSRKMGTAELQRNPKNRPVRIAAGALGDGLPIRDLVVSRQHRVLVQPTGHNAGEALVPAKDLVALPDVEILDHLEHGVEYFHVLCENHEVLFAEGMPAESMLTGTEALKALNETAREEIAILMPELQHSDYTPSPARMLLTGKQAREIVRLHLESNEPLMTPLN